VFSKQFGDLFQVGGTQLTRTDKGDRHMFGQRRSITLAAVVTVAALLFPRALAAAEAPECALLEDPQVMTMISGAGETALGVKCGDIAAAEIPSTLTEPTEVEPEAEPSAPGVDILVNDRTLDAGKPNRTQSEPSVAVLGNTVLVGYNDSGQLSGPNSSGDFTGYSRSVDNGSTWIDMGAPTTPLGVVSSVSGDPVLAADRNRVAGQNGVFYFANLGTSTANISIISVHKTINGGVSWAQAANASPLAVAGQFQDKEWLAVDTRAFGTGAGNVYVCWTRFGGAGGIQFSRSTNGGVSFTQQAANLSAGTTNVQGCVVAVDTRAFGTGAGNVYVAWLHFVSATTAQIRFRRSTDAGATFGPEIIAGPTFPLAETPPPNPCGRDAFFDTEPGFASRGIRSAPFPSMTVDPTDGYIHVVWHRAGLLGGSLSDIAHSTSTDNGVSFGPTERINSVVNGDQFFPAIAATTEGTLMVMYYSTQNSGTRRLIDVYKVTALAGELFGASERVTDVSFDRTRTNPNFDPVVVTCYMGDYNGITSPASDLGSSEFYLTWGDNRLPIPPGLPTAGLPDPDVRLDRD
jgi:hypothetical protein